MKLSGFSPPIAGPSILPIVSPELAVGADHRAMLPVSSAIACVVIVDAPIHSRPAD